MIFEQTSLCRIQFIPKKNETTLETTNVLLTDNPEVIYSLNNEFIMAKCYLWHIARAIVCARLEGAQFDNNKMPHLIYFIMRAKCIRFI